MKLCPKLLDGIYSFVSIAEGEIPPAEIIASFKEAEGFSAVVEKNAAEKYGFESAFDAAWIMIETETGLDKVGITALFSTALAKAGISCNVFAPIHHDHIFVPYKDGAKAVEILKKLDA
jgi:hypothetical protein